MLLTEELLDEDKAQEFMVDIFFGHHLQVFGVEIVWVDFLRNIPMLVLLEHDIDKPHERKFNFDDFSWVQSLMFQVSFFDELARAL
jgi:hypothetical protein